MVQFALVTIYYKEKVIEQISQDRFFLISSGFPFKLSNSDCISV
ncbi:hypothetical protein LEP1GSC185_2816 [Leptospira licerasiae serovar Varillal str. VAR 010]|uniref:Uncharacterized protein n=1 Tax=Leptospira licerasiae str. MMD4847 TaxID=1049971 RepID=A0ABN0H7X6_9LEPT|nr:hypothetical protein LEP1GSC185_2816 [Leptospira licerasiae serovar Varillal str. VAR 010]EJZ41834.1 hypothetical protein LEP1GSC178_0590 [Leptospira licerasiae str. MMD4847]